MASVPTVNILMSYGFKDILKFQESMTLSEFKAELENEGGSKQTYLFNNAPASNFISLKHKFGFSQGGKKAAAPSLELEFIDPEGVFEKNWFNIDTSAMVPIDDDPIGSALLRKQRELQEYSELLDQVENGDWDREINREADGSFGIFSDGATENNLEDYVENLEDQVDELEDLIDSDEYGDRNLELIQKQMDANTNQLQRPVWVTYGIGENLADWSPVMCFDRCTKMEYSFTGGGARTLKLVYDGVGIHPNLTQMGIGPLRGYRMGVVYTGESNPIFNEAAFAVEQGYYEPQFSRVEVDYEPDVWEPSIHKIIRDAIRRFVKRAVGMNTNVLCILPNLDHYLRRSFVKERERVRASMAGVIQGAGETADERITSNLQTTKEILERCGLKFVEELIGKHVAVGGNVWDRIENIEDPDEVMDWLQSKDMTAIISGDGVEPTIQETIANVMEKIKETVDDEGFIPDFSPYWYVETDFRMLQVMYKHFGLRGDDAITSTQMRRFETNSVGILKPVVVVGDRNTIRDFLQARMFDKQVLDSEGNVQTFDSENPQAAHEAALREQVRNKINPYDQADGLTYDFLKELYDVQIPVPWISPFGYSTGYDEEFLPDDVNLPEGNLEQIKREQPLSALRMPVFSLGTKSPNVLSLDIDINKQYYNLMHFSPQNRSAGQYVTAIMGHGSEESEEVTNIFNAIAELNLNDVDENGIPVGFEAIVEPYWDGNIAIWPGEGGEIDDLGGVETLFDHFGTNNDMPELVDPDGKDFDSKAEMVDYMWRAFKAIGETYEIIPRATRQSSGSSAAGGESALMTQAKMAASLASKALLGTITTTPMFHLSNDRRVVNRKALLYCVEPRFAAGNSAFEEGTDNLKTNLTWFSGTYIMTGFEHTISKGSVQSSFAINRPPGGRES